MKRVALVGDYREEVVAHRAIPLALQLTNMNVDWQWVETPSIDQDKPTRLEEFDAIWLVPGSPYRHMEGALSAVKFARTTGRPFLGTCGGFQHALIEFARDVCDLLAADHEELNPEAKTKIITPLACSLAGQSAEVIFTPGSYLESICGPKSTEPFNCNYGLNVDYKKRLEEKAIRFTAHDAKGAVRAFELPGHPFFVGLLFQPERLSLKGCVHPLIRAFCAL